MAKRNRVVLVVATVLGLCLFVFWQWQSFKKIGEQTNFIAIEYKHPTPENPETISDWQEYTNPSYNYQIKYPVGWRLFDQEANDGLAETELGGQAVQQGGSLFFSNKDSIDFTQETKPEDFRLLGVIVYEKAETDLDGFAELLGFTEEVGTSSVVFQAQNVVGKEYISVGITEDQPRTAIIFKNQDRFFVFHLGFVGNDTETLKIMEMIAGSFQVEE